MDIVLASDRGYLPHAGTLMRSIVENCANKHLLRFHLLSMDERVPDDETLGRFVDSLAAEKVETKIHLIDRNSPFIKTVPEGGTISNLSTYLRFFAPGLIDAEKLLYLDCDMIAMDDIEQLFRTELGDKMLGAVSDLFAGPSAYKFSFSMRYFNAGMLLINSKQWNRENSSETSMRFLRDKFFPMFNNRKHYGDQDILNMLFIGRVVYVHPRYNLVNPVLLRRSFFRGKIFEEACGRPGIVHFAGGAKPWNKWELHPLAKNYIAYRNMTPWAEMPEQKLNAKVLTRYISMWTKYYLPAAIYPFSETSRRLRGKPSRVVYSEQIEYLMNETSLEPIETGN